MLRRQPDSCFGCFFIRAPSEDAHDVHLGDDLVRRQHHNQAQKLGHKADRGGNLKLGAAAKADPVEVGGHHIAGGQDVVVVEVVDLVEVRAEEPGQVEDQQDYDGRLNGGQGDVPHHVAAVGAVHLGGLVERRVDGGHGGQIDDRAVAARFDDVGDHDDRAEHAGLCQEIDRIMSHHHQQLIEYAADLAGRGRIFQKDLHETGEDDPGEEVRQVGCRLDDGLEPLEPHLVEHQRQEDREHGAEEDHVAVDDDRVFERPPEVGVVHHRPEVVEPDPRRTPDAEIGVVILECQLDAVHWAVFKDEHKGEAWHHQQIEEPVAPHITDETDVPGKGFQRHSAGGGCFLHFITSLNN